MEKTGSWESPVIELRGVEFVNKGAELMLYAILDKIKKQWPDAVFVMEDTPRAPRSKHKTLGIYTKIDLDPERTARNLFLHLLPKSWQRRLHFLPENDIDLVLDGSGFAFGDFWGADKAGKRLADHIKRWKEHGKKVVLLPQAMGPFNDPRVKDKMQIILDYADLIFLRDNYSLDYLKAVRAKPNQVYRMPDFTNILNGTAPVHYEIHKKSIAIIPNIKVIDSKTLDHKTYLTLIRAVIDYILEKGWRPFFLIHGGTKDLMLAKEINDQCTTKIPIINEVNPLGIKGIIGRSGGVITSRFHALVSALCQAVPCLSVGWSHKYRALMEDYGYPEGLITLDDMEHNRVLDKVGWLLDEHSRTKIRERLSMAAEKQKEKTETMWNMVFDLVKS